MCFEVQFDTTFFGKSNIEKRKRSTQTSITPQEKLRAQNIHVMFSYAIITKTKKRKQKITQKANAIAMILLFSPPISLFSKTK